MKIVLSTDIHYTNWLFRVWSSIKSPRQMWSSFFFCYGLFFVQPAHWTFTFCKWYSQECAHAFTTYPIMGRPYGKRDPYYSHTIPMSLVILMGVGLGNSIWGPGVPLMGGPWKSHSKNSLPSSQKGGRKVNILHQNCLTSIGRSYPLMEEI